MGASEGYVVSGYSDPLIPSLRALRLQLLVQRWFSSTALSFCYSAWLCCVVLLLVRLFAGLGDPVPAYLGALVGGFLIGTMLAWNRRPSLLDAALAADARLGLKERLTSSLELAEHRGEMFDELHADARAHIGRLDVQRDFPLRVPKAFRKVWISVLMFGCIYILMPQYDLFGIQAKRDEARARFERIDGQVHALRSEAQKLAAVAPIDAESPLSETAALVDRLSGELERGEIGEKQALAKLTDLRDSFKERYESLKQQRPVPKIPKPEQFGAAENLAAALSQNNFARAAEELRKLQEKQKEGALSSQEMADLGAGLGELAQLLAGQDPALAQALEEAAQACQSGDAQAALDSLALKVEDIESLLKQLDELAKASKCLGCCMGKLGNRAAIGEWFPGESEKYGRGMGGPGRGMGGRVGELPEVDAAFDPSLLPGDVTAGKILMSVEQRAAPQAGQQPTIGYIEQKFVEAQQAAEQALEQEEIPRGSKDLVRQYFGTLESQPQSAVSAAAGAAQ